MGGLRFSSLRVSHHDAVVCELFWFSALFFLGAGGEVPTEEEVEFILHAADVHHNNNTIDLDEVPT